MKMSMRSDHLKAVLKYAIEQMESSCIEVLEFDANEEKLEGDAAVAAVKSMLQVVEQLTVESNKQLQLMSRLDAEQLLTDSIIMHFKLEATDDFIIADMNDRDLYALTADEELTRHAILNFRTYKD